MVLFRIQACCATYATRPETEKSPATLGTKRFSALKNVDLPHPTRPITMVSEPGLRSSEMFCSSKGGCSGASAATATASPAGASSSPFTGTPFRGFVGFLAPFFKGLAGGASSGFFGALGQRNVASLTMTRPGSDMSGGTTGLSSCSRNAPRRCTALSALSSVVSRKGTRISGNRSMLKSASAVYAVDAERVFPASE